MAVWWDTAMAMVQNMPGHAMVYPVPGLAKVLIPPQNEANTVGGALRQLLPFPTDEGGSGAGVAWLSPLAPLPISALTVTLSQNLLLFYTTSHEAHRKHVLGQLLSHSSAPPFKSSVTHHRFYKSLLITSYGGSSKGQVPGLIPLLMNTGGKGGNLLWWPDALTGPNPEATGQILAHLAQAEQPGKIPGLSPTFYASRFVMELGVEEKLESLPGVMGPLEAAMMLDMRGGRLGVEWATSAITALLKVFMDQFGTWHLLSSPDDPTVERMMHVAVALSRLGCLVPPAFSGVGALVVVGVGGEQGEQGEQGGGTAAGSKVGECTPTFACMALQEFLFKTASTPKYVERTGAWEWWAVGEGEARGVTLELALASTTLGTHGPHRVSVGAKEVGGIPVRRHLLQCLAGPVTHLSATAEATATALARPSLAVLAALQLQRLRRALRVFGLELYEDLDTCIAARMSFEAL